MDSWQLQEAKNKLSEVVNLAVAGKPQVVTRHGKPVAVISSIEDYKKSQAATGAKPKKTFAEFLLSMPKLPGDDEDLFVRSKGGKLREIDWE